MPKREARIIEMPAESEKTFRELYELFVISHAARGVSETTLKNYDYHMRNIAKYLDVEQIFEAITKRDIEAAITNMRRAGLAHNSIATYTRLLRAFYHWCGEEGYSSIDIPNIKEKETVKETYTDEELERLLKRPAKNCDFAEYRSWVIVNFLMNSGCRAATVRNIQNRDVDLEAKNVIFRHNKNGKIQTIPLCGLMVSILRDYMKVRKGKPEEYLFCDIYGGMLTEDALRHSIVKYNHKRGVESTSIHKFRHTFARKYLADCGGNAFTLQKLMGHSTLKMTKHYCAIFDSDISKDFDKYSPLAQLKHDKDRITRR